MRVLDVAVRGTGMFCHLICTCAPRLNQMPDLQPVIVTDTDGRHSGNVAPDCTVLVPAKCRRSRNAQPPSRSAMAARTPSGSAAFVPAP